MTHRASKPNTRAAAAALVEQWLRTEEFPEHLLGAETDDRAFVMEVLYGVVRWQRALRWALDGLASRQPDACLLPHLLVGLYQVLLMDTVPAYAAVNETVAAASSAVADLGRKHARAATGFVNAVLKQAATQRQAIVARLAREDTGIRTSHPDILVQRWTARYGRERTEAVCAWDNRRPEVVIHANPLRMEPAALLAALRAAGVQAVPHPACDGALVLPRGARVPDVPGYAEGAFSVQDPATVLAVDLLDPQPGECVLDACAAPGGKSILIGGRMRDRGRLVAADVQAPRVAMLRANLKRMGLACATASHADAAGPEPMERLAAGRLFDRILLDVPCTNTGVLARRPDARWRFSVRRLQAVRQRQAALLNNLSRFVAPGGTLVYSTCSIEPEENEGLIETWLRNHPEWRLSGSRQVLPGERQSDGAYAARLEMRRT